MEVVNFSDKRDAELRQMPSLKIKSIHIKGFKTFDDFKLDCTNPSEAYVIKDFFCLIGPNGYGKSTVLNAIEMLFSRLEGQDKARILANLGKAVRHVGKNESGVFNSKDFEVSAQMQSSVGDYEVSMNKNGFVKDHPAEVKPYLSRICYFSKFDQAMHNFQLARDKWPTFKRLFEAITGFEIEENTDIDKYFSGIQDSNMKMLIDNFVFNFFIKKPYEIINQKECSDGERKIIKSFSTLLTLPYKPKIVLIDNIEMHVQITRHFKLIESLKECFPDSQIFSTTHSYYVSRMLGKKAGIEDLRLVHAEPIIRSEPWRLRLIDELEDSLMKLKIFNCPEDKLEFGKKLLLDCYSHIKDLDNFKLCLKSFLEEVPKYFVNDVLP